MATVRARAAVLATVGSLGIAASAYLDWFDDRAADTVPLARMLFSGEATDTAVSYWQSVAGPLVVIGALGTLGALLLSRAVLWIAFVLALAGVGVWATNEVLDRGASTLSVGDFGPGAYTAVVSLLVLLFSTIALRGGSSDDDERDPDGVTALPRGYGATSTSGYSATPSSTYDDTSATVVQPSQQRRNDTDDGT